MNFIVHYFENVDINLQDWRNYYYAFVGEWQQMGFWEHAQTRSMNKPRKLFLWLQMVGHQVHIPQTDAKQKVSDAIHGYSIMQNEKPSWQ